MRVQRQMSIIPHSESTTLFLTLNIVTLLNKEFFLKNESELKCSYSL